MGQPVKLQLGTAASYKGVRSSSQLLCICFSFAVNAVWQAVDGHSRGRRTEFLALAWSIPGGGGHLGE